jgi:hypothetical protein
MPPQQQQVQENHFQIQVQKPISNATTTGADNFLVYCVSKIKRCGTSLNNTSNDNREWGMIYLVSLVFQHVKCKLNHPPQPHILNVRSTLTVVRS